MLWIYKKPQWHTIYWAAKDVKHAERVLGRPVAYHHVMQEVNCIVDDMVCSAFVSKDSIKYMQGDVPKYTPSNQMEEVYVQQGA